MFTGPRLTAIGKLLIFPLTFFAASVLESCSATRDTQNYGLSKPQDVTTLPKSLAPISGTIRKSKTPAVTNLIEKQDGLFSVLNGWELIEAEKVCLPGEIISKAGLETSKWYNATVPGTVLTTLVDQGIYPDPYYGLNNLSITDSLCRKDWWYRTSFKVPESAKNKNKWIIFEGINYTAEIWFNGNKLGQINGAFQRGIFDLSKYFNESDNNVLAVHIIPPFNPGIPHEESPSAGQGPNGGRLCLDGPTFISSEGWDWIPGIRDRNIGIWQDVDLKFTGPITILDPQVITDLPLPDTSQADITIKTELYNSSDKSQLVILSGKIADVVFKKNVKMGPKEKLKVTFSPEEYKQLKFNSPHLWWPNGYGSPYLYDLELSAVADNNFSDKKSLHFGIRELSYEMSVDYPNSKDKRIEFNPIKDLSGGKPVFDNTRRRDVGYGTSVAHLRDGVDTNLIKQIPSDPLAPYLAIKVNGQRIFCKGGNWGMDDGMKRVSRKALEPYFKLHRDAHFNMIRNWTGESTEELFYTLADEYGLLVWNDFWMSTEGYNVPPLDNKLFLDNVTDVIKRFRNHPSIVIWCPRNEGYAPFSMENDLSTLVAVLDGTRLYNANSRYMNLTPSGPWHYFKDPADYFRNCARGFNTELGTPSIPTASSMKKMMAKEDLWPISDVWYYHDLHFGQWDYRKALDSLYGVSSGLFDFCKKAQMINFESHRAMFEAWNSKLWNNTSGILLWMTHPAWPSTVWQVYSWDYETFGSYYGSKKACEPVHVQMNLNDDKISVINTSFNSYRNAKVKLSVYDLSGKEIFQKESTVDVKANSLTACFVPVIPENFPEVFLKRLTLISQDGSQLLSMNDYWGMNRLNKNYQIFNTLPKVKLSGELIKTESYAQGRVIFTLLNPSSVAAISIKVNLHDEKGNIILPAYCSDGYFNLLPGEKKQLTMEFDNPDLRQNLKIAVDGYNVEQSELLNVGQLSSVNAK